MQYINIGVESFVNDHFDGSRKRCSKTIKISESTLCKVIRGKSKPGLKLATQIIKFCETNNIDYHNYLKF